MRSIWLLLKIAMTNESFDFSYRQIKKKKKQAFNNTNAGALPKQIFYSYSGDST